MSRGGQTRGINNGGERTRTFVRSDAHGSIPANHEAGSASRYGGASRIFLPRDSRYLTRSTAGPHNASGSRSAHHGGPPTTRLPLNFLKFECTLRPVTCIAHRWQHYHPGVVATRGEVKAECYEAAATEGPRAASRRSAVCVSKSRKYSKCSTKVIRL